MKQKTSFENFGNIGYRSMNGRYIGIGPSHFRRVESLRVIGLQARVHVESHEISNFFYIFYAMKWRPIG